MAARIGRTVLDLSDGGWLNAVERFSVLERELLELAQADAEKREIMRRVCEATVVEISTSRPPPDAIAYERVWQRMLEVGFTNDERRMSMHVFRLMYLIDTCLDPEKIQSELSTFGEEVEALRGHDPQLAKSFSRAYERLRNRLLKPQSPGGGAWNGLVPPEWKFVVRGSLTRGVGGARLDAYDVIVTSDAREGPHVSTGRGPIGHPGDDQSFCTWYVTEGADRAIEPPRSVQVSLRVARGEWKPYVVPVQLSHTRVISTNELHIDIGVIPIESDQQVYVPDEP